MRYRKLYAALGAVLGLGAPLGALVLRGFWIERPFWTAWAVREWVHYGYFYIYMAVGCVSVFAAFGYFIGRRGDRLTFEQEETADTFQNLNLQALTDGLTGLYNHRYLQERIVLEIEAAERHGNSLTGLMIDLDNFKSINDHFGHPFGDLVLLTIGQIIRENLRRIDLPGRYGGEEFMVLMPHTGAQEALEVAERIRKAVESYVFTLKDDEIHLTLSIGVAVYPSEHPRIRDKASFLKAMDQALYQAKWRGKNRIMLRGAEPPVGA